jgi:pSer/pThr/pTyr-binding forkhead associated (FHA) protein
MYTTQPSDESSTSPSGPPAPPHVSLHIVRGQARERVRHVNTPAFLIGSASDCDLVIGDLQFPRVSAYLIVHSSGVFARHLGFEPEMIVNGRQATRVALHDGDRLQLGPYEFIVGIERRRTDPEHGRSSLGSLPVGALNRLARESDTDVVATVSRLIEDVRQALGLAPRAIPLVAVARNRPFAAGPGLAAS